MDRRLRQGPDRSMEGGQPDLDSETEAQQAPGPINTQPLSLSRRGTRLRVPRPATLWLAWMERDR